MTEHVLKVVPPYFDALVDGSKAFEVRRNDRAFQCGDLLILREWHSVQPTKGERGGCHSCRNHNWLAHWADESYPLRPGDRTIRRVVTFVYSGDPRFGGIEPGHVVLGLAPSGEEGGQ